MPQAEKLQIVLTDLSGRIVEFISAETFEAGEHQIQIAGKLAKGVYFLKISDGKQQQNYKGNKAVKTQSGRDYKATTNSRILTFQAIQGLTKRATTNSRTLTYSRL